MLRDTDLKKVIDKSGNLIPDKVYKSDDFEKNIVIDERTELVAKKLVNI